MVLSGFCRILLLLPFAVCLSAVASHAQKQSSGNDSIAFVGARIIDGTGRPPIEKGVVLIRGGHIEAVGEKVKVPASARRIDATGKTIIPGLISAHSHVNSAPQLGIYLRDGITTVLSLGGDKEFALRDESHSAPAGTVPHLYVAGPIQDSTAIPGAVAVKSVQEARQNVDDLAKQHPDIIKLRVDDFLGARQKMSPDIYAAIIDEAHKKGLRAAAHVVLLDDGQGLLQAGVDYIAHSIRDKDVDADFIQAMKRNHAFYCPTLTREVAVFTYSETPSFFDDPFFRKEADPAEIAKLQDPKNQEKVKNDAGATWYKNHFPIAMRNLKALSDAGIPIVMGTDSGGGLGRFQGYFEHLELEYEVKAGLTPMQALLSATSTPAKLIRVADHVGTLEKGKQADLLVLTANPLDDIRNTRKIESVWIGGIRVQPKAQ